MDRLRSLSCEFPTHVTEMQAAVNVYFQARYSQGHEGAAEEADFLALARISRQIMLNARHYGGPLLHTFMRVMLDMIHTEPTHFAVCFDGGMPAAFIQMLHNGMPSITCLMRF